MRRIAFVLGCALASAACTSPPLPLSARTAQGAPQCFWGSEVKGFSDAGPDRAIVRLGQQEIWELTLSPGCPDVDWAMKIGIVSRGGQRICADRPAELVIPSASGTSSQRCLVHSVRKLSPDEASAARGETPR